MPKEPCQNCGKLQKKLFTSFRFCSVCMDEMTRKACNKFRIPANFEPDECCSWEIQCATCGQTKYFHTHKNEL